MSINRFSRWISKRQFKTNPSSDDYIPVADSAHGLELARTKPIQLENFIFGGPPSETSVWDDYMIPGWSVKATGNSPPDILTGFAGNANLELFVFDGGNNTEQVFFTIQMPHRWKEGSRIYPHVRFSPVSTNTNDAVSRTVRFGLEYTMANPSGEIFGLSSTVPMVSGGFVPATSQWSHRMAGTSGVGIDMTGMTISCMLICRLFRDPTHEDDTYPQDVAFLQFDIHHEIDALGSRQILVK